MSEEEKFEKYKKNRTVLRGSCTRLINQIDNCLKSDIIEFETLEESIDQLSIKYESLMDIDNKIEPLIKIDEYDSEVASVYEYRDKISLTLFRGRKKIKNNEKKNSLCNNDSYISDRVSISHSQSEPVSENKFVKLPKLTISKYFGQSTQYLNFWNTFKVSIHDNPSLSKIQKFNYLRSYLGGPAAAAIEGFEITDDNYDAALKILEERFGSKDLIIQEHFNKLLNLTPVYKLNDISKLRKMHDEIETNVRSLSSLGIKSESYSPMLTAIVLKNIPSILTLEFNRKHVNSSNIDIFELLDFIQTEIRVRERSIFDHNSGSKEPDPPKNKLSWKNHKLAPSTQEFVAVAEERTRPKKECIFCNSFHSSSLCNTLSVEKKREILKDQNRCYLCLGLKHKIKNCKFAKTVCKICKGKHNENICFRSDSFHTHTEPNKDTNQLDSNKNETDTGIVTAVSHNQSNRILLQTGCAIIKSETNAMLTRILFDTGSMRTFLRKKTADMLELKPIRKEKLSVYTFGNKTPIEKAYDVVSLTLENRHAPASKIKIEALITNDITGSHIPPPESRDIFKIEALENLTLADYPDCKEPVSLLVGADYYYNMITGKIKHLSKTIVAVESIFGWCLQSRNAGNDTALTLNVIVEENLISDHIKRFYDLETSGLIDEKNESDFSENEVLKQFESDVSYKNRRYEVRLPWKFETRELNDNRKIAEARFAKLRKRFQRDPQLFFEYREVLRDYLKQGIIELAPNSNTDVTFYLPHREVIRRDRETSKLRIVFDASSHEINSPSLNNCLHVGPNLYPEIFCILLRFRLNEIAFMADMKQAFLQIMLNTKDRNVTRFLFTEAPFEDSEPLSVYRFTRVLFGINSSPFLLAATIKFHLKKYSETYSRTVEFLNENIYVDDIIGSLPSVDEVLKLSRETIKIFEDASISLHKWKTNSGSLLKEWQKEGITSDESPCPETFSKETLPSKVLGISWNCREDFLFFDVRELMDFVSKRIDTKRFILQVLGRIFDPIGFLGPFTLRIKCLMQKVWSLGVEWDEKLPKEIISLWTDWCDEIHLLENFSVPRYYFSTLTSHNIDTFQLHFFSDASTRAFGTVAYLRVTTRDQQILTSFVASKNRIAPLKSLTLPRLELMGCLLSAKLSRSILKALNLEVTCHYWTDSKIAYFWIHGVPEKFKPFIKNRVQTITSLTSASNWHHCPGIQNPADIVSRPTKASKLISDEMWINGPQWLRLPPNFWPKSDDQETIDSPDLEYRKFETICQQKCIVEERKHLFDISKFSNLEKILRITVWIKRFIKKLKRFDLPYGPLTSEELIEAEKLWVCTEQETFFAKELQSLREDGTVEKDCPLYNYMPYLDENGLIRLGGRLEFCNLSIEEKHPLILPKNSWLTTLIVRREHQKVMHGGTASTLAKVRSNYWIPKGRQLVRRVIKDCIVCRKYLAKPSNQLTAPLPSDRINETPPFSVCGLDFAGPLYVKHFGELRKSYIALFTCGVTRSLHLELVSDMTTDSFLLAFRRFLARRGNCKVIYSDNAKTFLKSKKEIENLSKILTNSTVQNFVSKERIVWKNIIERSPWWGGFYERLVRCVKECLHKILGKALLNFEEMTTVLTEIELVLNLRPLTYVYDDVDEPRPLTPMHFINFGQNQPSYPVTFAEIIDTGSKKSSLLKRKKYQQLLLKQLWLRWKKQYLLDLRTAHSVKNSITHAEFKVGDVVLIEENTKNKLLWKLGKIERALPGRDNKIRCYELKTSGGLLKRTVQHLYPFEL